MNCHERCGWVGRFTSTPASPQGGRDARIDAAKALGMVLVVFGHSKGFPDWFIVLIYSFPVPLFFLLSGWVAGMHTRERGFGERLLQLVRTLLVPYLFFFFLGYLYWLLTRHIGEKAVRWGTHPWWEPLKGLLLGVGADLYVQPALWFLPALFVTALTYHVLSKCVPLPRLVVLTWLASWIWIQWFPGVGTRLPFALDEMPVALFFFVFGAMAARGSWLRLFPKTKRGNLILLAVLLLPWFGLAWCNTKVDMNMLLFGASPLLFYVVALLGTAIVLCVSALVEHCSVVQWIGRNTLLITCTHPLVFFVFSGVLSLLGIKSGVISALLIPVITLYLTPIFRWILMKWMPWSLGASSSVRMPAK
ncbi:acyltransferase family protein [Xylella taiwanensis]|uniref:acyltransferase family protein n=2 Tax=Xylella taiwanensis TaxID=1444770 RepID=UPI000E10D40B|nr:acyltransferase family protein [Xylella taiwanensis]AXI83279.1 polysaccharide biosynthesis protein GumF [Xylella taiwanensis]UFM93495.1 acyltransferase family protein [Xylella taiwanensis]UFN02078.1 acyltransferase family protein [Xylella taiwanensis]UFN06547.1 acyltransferase family protein [Xylella taiwanensis]UFN08841.1 acyltransferase family protein [Xylella taiwanensis]